MPNRVATKATFVILSLTPVATTVPRWSSVDPCNNHNTLWVIRLPQWPPQPSGGPQSTPVAITTLFASYPYSCSHNSHLCGPKPTSVAITASQMSRVVRKPAFCICENKDADQLRGNREADQRLCFRYIESTIPLLSKSEISSL